MAPATDSKSPTLQAAAYRVIEQHQTLKLSIEESEVFVEAMLNPSEPNEALKSAALRHKKIMSV